MNSLFGWLVAIGVLAVLHFAIRAAARRWIFFDRFLAIATGETASIPGVRVRRGEAIFWWIVGAVFLALALVALERIQPYYFSQDDVLVSELPGMLEGCRSLWHGVWPDYDPCRLMGGPLAPEGVFSLTYPPTYLSYAIAHHVLHNEYALTEVFAVLHEACGYVILWLLCARMGMRPSICTCCALCFLLSGSVLIIGRSWHTFIPLVVWVPLMMLAIERFAAGPVGLAWAIGTGLAGGILFHVGFPQAWVYALLGISLAGLWQAIAGAVPWSRLLWGAVAGLIAVGIAAPLLLPQMACATGVIRDPPHGAGIITEWKAALLPYPLVQVPHPMGWGSTDLKFMGQMFYFGSVFAVLFAAGFIALLGRCSRRAWAQNTWLVLAVIAMLMCMGSAGVLFSITSHLPLVRNVSDYPFRALPFFVIFATIGAGMFLERSLEALGRGKWMEHSIALLTFCLLAYHVALARASFYTYGFEPYPQLPKAVARRIEGIENGRMMSWSTVRSISPDLADTLPLDLPMLADVAAFGGYDPLLEYRDVFRDMERRLNVSPLDMMRIYGVRWHLISPLVRSPVVSLNPGVLDEETAVLYRPVLDVILPQLKLITHWRGTRLTELGGVAPMSFTPMSFTPMSFTPMSFTRDRPALPLPLTARGDGIRVDLRHLDGGGKVIVNFVWFPQMRASIDGEPVPVRQDEYHRIVIDAPPGARRLHIRYAAPWGLGGAIGVSIVLIALIGGWLMRDRCALPNVNIQPAN
jgi:hypothetical protein